MASPTEGTATDVSARPSLADGYRADIDGLRAVAILLVVAYHAGWDVFGGGYVGVDVFFVVSGYLITGLLLREVDRTGGVSLREFYARRARRLLPLSTTVLVATAALGAWLLPPLARVDLLADARASALYVANWRFSRLAVAYSDVEVSETPLVHYWSLAIEEQFYLLWPLLIVGAVHYAGRRGRTTSVRPVLSLLLAAVVIGSLTASILLTPRLGPAAYYVTHTRLWELGIGGGLAMLMPRFGPIPRRVAESAAVIGLGAVLLAALVYDAGTSFPGAAALVPVLGTVLLVVAGTHPRTAVSRLLAMRPLPNLGRWSYAWYLWHWPALGLLALANQRLTEPFAARSVTFVAITGSLALAGVSHHLIENPLRHARPLRPPVRSLAFGAGLTLLPVVAVTGYLAFGDVGAGLVQPTAQAAAEEGAPADTGPDPASAPGPHDLWSDFDPPQGPVSPAAAAEDVPTSALDCVARPGELASIRPCTFGDPDGGRVVLLVGDSHAAHWLPAVHEIGLRRGWQVLLATKGSCAVTDVPITEDDLPRRYAGCDEFRAGLFADMEQLGDVHLVIIGRVAHVADRVLGDDGSIVTDPDELFEIWRLGSRRTFERLLGSAEHVVGLRAAPGAPHDVPGCLSGSLRDPGVCDFPDGPAADTVLHAAEVAAAGGGVTIVDPSPLVCATDPCRVVADDGTIKYRDRAHLTSRFARQLAPRFDALLPVAVHAGGEVAPDPPARD